MRFAATLGVFCLTFTAAAENPASRLWTELKSKRESLPGVHQEFEAARTVKTAHRERSMKQRVLIDMSQGKWRERSVSGSGDHTSIFDGKDVLFMEADGAEYTRAKRQSKGDPAPSPYSSDDLDWPQAEDLGRQACGVLDRQCVILQVPVKPWIRGNSTNHMDKLLEGNERWMLDTETGLLVSRRSIQIIDDGQRPYQVEFYYILKRMSYGSSADPKLFELPSRDMRQVKELPRWSSSKIKKQLAGKPAPELAVNDLQGTPIALSALKGKTVLLDFWTTWCPPCRADAPALDKLYLRYGGKDLMIVAISVSEDREVVEKFLKEHPHPYPVVLTSENDMPRVYQISAFPTYIVIDRDGTLEAAVEGDQGFGDLRKLLKKAGLEAE